MQPYHCAMASITTTQLTTGQLTASSMSRASAKTSASVPKSFSPLEPKFDLLSSNATKRMRHYSQSCLPSMTSEYDLILKVILLGDQGVGKTSFLRALRVHPDVDKVKCQCRQNQVSDHVEMEITTATGKLALVRLCDTGGQERYRSLTSSYYRGAHGVLLMFDVRSHRSLDNVDVWMEDLDSFILSKSCSRVLIANRCSAPDREVMAQDGRKFAESRGLPYFECDVAQYYNVIEGIQLMVERIAREVTIDPSLSTVIRPSLPSDETYREKKAFECLC